VVDGFMHKDNIRFLVFAGLSNRSLESFLELILQAENTTVDVVRSEKGTHNPRVTYHYPPKSMTRYPILIILWKVLITFRLAFSGKFDISYSIHSVPHLYLGYLASIISRKPLLYYIIAGVAEFEWHGGLLQQFTERIARRARFVIVSNQSTINYLVNLGVERRRIIHYRFMNLTAIKNFHPLDIEKSLHLVVVSALLKFKHVDIFIDIVETLKNSIPDITAGIVGDGPECDALSQYAALKGLSKNITFYGYVTDPEELNRILNSAEIFVLNSSHEGGPFTIIEAMYAGICCVASKVGDVKYRIKHGHDGYIVNRYDDVEEYVSRILYLLENPKILIEFQKNAAETRYNIQMGRIGFWQSLITHLSN
jgi:glycosyltransferase involved in cell wall biosynthesis